MKEKKDSKQKKKTTKSTEIDSEQYYLASLDHLVEKIRQNEQM